MTPPVHVRTQAEPELLYIVPGSVKRRKFRTMHTERPAIRSSVADGASSNSVKVSDDDDIGGIPMTHNDIGGIDEALTALNSPLLQSVDEVSIYSPHSPHASPSSPPPSSSSSSLSLALALLSRSALPLPSKR